MDEAAHPQHDEPGPAPAGPEPAPPDGALANPFPEQMTVPGADGRPVTVALAVLDGVVYAPGLDDLPLPPPVRQYVTQYCAAWSSSVLTTGKLATAQEMPRRAQLVFRESQLHAMLGLAADERIARVVVDDLTSTVRFVVESPRLPAQPAWDGGPPIIGLPIAAWYEGSEAPR